MARRTNITWAAAGAAALVGCLGGPTSRPLAESAPVAVAFHGHAMASLPVAQLRSAGNRSCQLQGNPPACWIDTSADMTYHNGLIMTSPQLVYIVRWGWTSDPSGEATYQEHFFQGVGGSTWGASQTQYCNHGPVLVCPANASYVGNSTGLWQPSQTWVDNLNPVPTSPTDADIQAEVSRAVTHFLSGNSTFAWRQFIIDTPHGNSSEGFAANGGAWCAYHSAFTDRESRVLAYTNFPYITDAGASCGENYVNSGSAGLLDGVSIVGGHEYAETITDPVPYSGWNGGVPSTPLSTTLIGVPPITLTGGDPIHQVLNPPSPDETGDKCAWIPAGLPGAAVDIGLSTGSFAVQSLWSNNDNNDTGGCVTYYYDSSNQG